MNWLEAPEGVLYFEREPGVRVAVNMTEEPVRLAASGEVLVASGPDVEVSEGTLTLPAESSTWLSS